MKSFILSIAISLTGAFLAAAFGQTPLPTVSPRPRNSEQSAPVMPAQVAPTTVPAAKEIAVDDALEAWITAEVLQRIPREYVNDKRWGLTTQLMSGLKWEIDGGKIETRRRWKTVNHGTWTRSVVKLIEPEREFHIAIDDLKSRGNGTFEFDLRIRAKLDCFARMARWNYGVQAISLSVEADATAELVAHFVTEIRLDGNTFPPDIVLSPRATSAKLTFHDLEIRNISRADGPLVHALSDLAKDAITDNLQEQEAKLVERINAQLEKRSDKLRLPLSKLATSKWGAGFGTTFPGLSP